MFERILVLCDRLPTGFPDRADVRLSRLIAELVHLWPRAEVTAVATDGSLRYDGREWLEALGVRVVLRPTDVLGWLEQRPLEFSVVLLVGISTYRFTPHVRRTQPQALVVADMPLDALEARNQLRPTLATPEERLGGQLIGTVERHTIQEAMGAADAILTQSSVDPDWYSRIGKTFAFDGPLDKPTPGEPSRRAGAVLVARFAAELGDPDEEGVEALLDWFEQAGDTHVAGLRCCLVQPSPTQRRRVAAMASVATGALRDEVAGARVLVTVRPFGASPRWQQDLAFATGTPWVVLGPAVLPGAIPVVDVVELRRTVAALTEDDNTWLEAQRRLLEAGETRYRAREARAGLVALLGSVGFVPPDDAAVAGPSARLREPEPLAPLHDAPSAVHGQVQSAGWNEHRPISSLALRAEVSLDYLFPHVSYGWWYDAHRLTPEVADAMRVAAATFAHQPLISIVMPVYNTDAAVLDASIGSVRAQLYRNWELCIADDASTSRGTIDVLDRHAREDTRIRVRRLSVNGGIAAGSNAAAALATGEFIALLDHDDLLTPDALFEVVSLLDRHPDIDFIYSDEDKLDEHGHVTSPFFKPSWSPELHLCVNYVTHFAVYRKRVFDQAGGFRSEFEGSQDYDLSLRVTEITDRVGHIAKPIYTWRMVSGSAAVAHDAKPYAVDAARRAVAEALRRRGVQGGRVDPGLVHGTWRPRYPIAGRPVVSVLIPTRNSRDMLERCIDGVRKRTAYDRIELVVVDNASDDPETLSYLARLDAVVVRYPYAFNYARQMNLAAAVATGDLLLLLNNDIEIADSRWLEAMIEHAQRPEVGAVGARLVFPTGRPQHEGVFVGFGGGSAGNIDFGDYFGLGRMVRDCTAVTAACMLVRPAVFGAVGGFDERLRVAFNDVDFCLRLRQRGYRVIYTPYAELVHAESKSRGSLHPTEDQRRFTRRWGSASELTDPFYNPNLDPVRAFRLLR